MQATGQRRMTSTLGALAGSRAGRHRWGDCGAMENSTCYVNGSFVPQSEAKVSIFDRGFTSGEGVYEVTRSFGHKLFKLDEHLGRLFRSLKYTRIDCGMPVAEMKKLSLEVFERTKPLLDHD